MLCQHGETSASLICFRQIDIDVENLFVRKMGEARPEQTIPQSWTWTSNSVGVPTIWESLCGKWGTLNY